MLRELGRNVSQPLELIDGEAAFEFVGLPAGEYFAFLQHPTTRFRPVAVTLPEGGDEHLVVEMVSQARPLVVPVPEQGSESDQERRPRRTVRCR